MSYDEHLISMAGGDGEVSSRIARIEASNALWMDSSVTDRTDHDIKFLLALVREQAAKLEAVEEWCDANQYPAPVEDLPYTFSAQDYALDDAARRIRAALTVTATS